MDLAQIMSLLMVPVPAYFVLAPLGILAVFFGIMIVAGGKNSSATPVAQAQPVPQVATQNPVPTNTFVAPPAPPIPPIPQELAAQPEKVAAPAPAPAPAPVATAPATPPVPEPQVVTQPETPAPVPAPAPAQAAVPQEAQTGWKAAPAPAAPATPTAPIVA